VQCLLAYGANPHEKDQKGHSPVHIAAKHSHRQVLVLLLAHSPLLNTDGDPSAQTCLHVAAHIDNVDLVNQLIDNVDVIDVDQQDALGRTPLHAAAMQGHVTVVATLLEKRANIHQQDNDGQTALHWAAIKGHVGVVGELLAKGANIHQQDYLGRTALHLAAQRKDVEMVKLLRKEEAKQNTLPAKPSSLLAQFLETVFVVVVRSSSGVK
jgi:ankyrin repeat protein